MFMFKHRRSVPVEGDIGVTACDRSNRSSAAAVPMQNEASARERKVARDELRSR